MFACLELAKHRSLSPRDALGPQGPPFGLIEIASHGAHAGNERCAIEFSIRGYRVRHHQPRGNFSRGAQISLLQGKYAALNHNSLRVATAATAERMLQNHYSRVEVTCVRKKSSQRQREIEFPITYGRCSSKRINRASDLSISYQSISKLRRETHNIGHGCRGKAFFQ